MSDNLNQRSYRDALTGYHNPPVFLKTNPFNLPHSNDGLYAACLRIMAKVHELGLDLELDSKTPGDGACFFWAVLQQLRRKEIYPLLRTDLKELADTNDAATLRMRVCNFGLHSPVIQQNKKDLIYDTDEETWDEYWKNMKKVSKWASGAVLRTAAVSKVPYEVKNGAFLLLKTVSTRLMFICRNTAVVRKTAPEAHFDTCFIFFQYSSQVSPSVCSIRSFLF